ncbi:MAG TPA: hypothetical protein VFJ14_03505 [Nocardioidaceae bacterium]|nr:hypothetical protein [Nocardioidaceae bacterium]
MKKTLIDIVLVSTFGVLLVVGLLAAGLVPTPLEMAVVAAALVGAIVTLWLRGTKAPRH